MKLITTLKMATIAGVALLAVKSEASFTSEAFFSSTTPGSGGLIVFTGTGSGATGGSFSFTDSSADPTTSSGQWQILTGPAGSFGFDTSIRGLYGSVLASSAYTYGPITTSGSTESAPVTASGTGQGNLEINDGLGNLAGDLLTGKVNWLNLSSTTGGANDQVNTMLAVNITGLAYSGANLGLKQLATEGDASGAGITITFSAGEDLLSLAADGNGAGSAYSGTIAVPEPTTMVAGAMLLLPFGMSTLRGLRRKSAV